MIPKSPCDPKCQKRSATCHAECEKWAEYVIKRDREYEEREAIRRGMYTHADRMRVNEKIKYIMREGKDVKTL